MKEIIAYDDAVDLLDADHNVVKKLFTDYNACCEDGSPAAARRGLAERICQELTVHAQIEEEIFYPEVRKAIGDDALMDEALAEHAEAKDLIARIQDMKVSGPDADETVKKLGKLIDQHVREERQQIFLQARQSALNLRALTVPLFERRKQLKGGDAAKPKAAAAKPAKKENA